nr:nicalin-1-like [Tanacetum cinerariifolium]
MALYEIARLFSILDSNPNTRRRYNILFRLTSGGPYNYNGTQNWLRSFDQRLRESIDYAICQNSLHSGENELWLHVSKSPENAYVKQIFEVNDNITSISVPTLENNLAGDFYPALLTDPDNKMKQQQTLCLIMIICREKMRRRLNARTEYTKFLEDTVIEMAKEVRIVDDEILGFGKLFNDQLTLCNISRVGAGRRGVVGRFGRGRGGAGDGGRVGDGWFWGEGRRAGEE